jgi:FtsP/CotA-like multicopper oxidase with cupredoxin domain
MPKTIDGKVEKTTEVTFGVGSKLDELPAPQWQVDGHVFTHNKIRATFNAQSVVAWQINSTKNYFHPFHIHVNPFIVQGFETNSSLPQHLAPYWDSIQEPVVSWRDTVFLPPFGSTRILQKFGSDVGKTIFHCHFSDHQDEGMVAAIMIEPASQSAVSV